ncbi:MAG: amidohydrolase [Melioribacteraceae bacterium]|nr:amidohydrolase [Melioribacteraceae bacterium]MCF8263061.1 amidohydrolase [Melioribacteraceae bacterium]MCF8431247.1 amidohydrolase [Melioribacteraceae bacterium]
MRKLINSTIILITALSLSSCYDDIKEADLVFINGNVKTVDSNLPEAEAVAVNSDTISFVGSSEDVRGRIGEKTQVVDLKGRLLIPGFIESHAHLRGIGKSQIELNLKSAASWDEVVFMVSEAAYKIKPGDWIIGRGWHQEKFDPEPNPNIEGYPLHNDLSEATKMNPVILNHASGHAIFANKKAMELAGISNSTKDPAGGRIVRDTEGNPIGVLEETAKFLVTNLYKKDLEKRTSEEIKSQIEKEIILGIDECVSKGITSFHDAGSTFEDIDVIKGLVDQKKNDLRLYLMIGENNDSLKSRIKDYRFDGYGDGTLTVRSIKRYIDGALGSRGAWMLEEYSDLPGHFGQKVNTLAYLEETARIAIENGFQICTHAIGDRGNREILNVYEKVITEYGLNQDLRWRVEHAQHLTDEDIPRFAELGVIPAMQGVHCTSDAVFVPQRIGYDRAEEGAYVWRKLLEAGAIVCNGTDAPVEDVSPIQNYYSTVTRKLDDGSTFFPEQAMTRMEALRSATIYSAYAAFEENIKGSITKGKLADMVVLSNDILTVPSAEIKSTEILYTVIDGKIVYQK